MHEASFDGADWYALVVNTEPLLREIGRRRLPRPSDEEIEDQLEGLYETLTEALRPETSHAKLRAACARAELLRGWLLDLLAEPDR